MNGVRVQGIEPQCPERMVRQYFADLCGSAAITSVYYPVLNNNAIVIFKDPSAAVKVLTSTHDKWTVLPLPNQVFSKQRVWLQKELSDVLQRNEQYQEMLRNIGQVDISVEKGSQQIMLTGQSYQIEWAWRYLSDLQDQLQQLSGFVQSARTSNAAAHPNGDFLINGDIAPASLQDVPHAGHRSLTGPAVHSVTSLLNGDAVSVSDVRSLAVEGVSGGRRLPSPGSAGSGSTASGDRGRERGRAGAASADITSLALVGPSDERLAPSSSSTQERALLAERGESPEPTTSAAVEDSRQRDHPQSMLPRDIRRGNSDDKLSGHASLPPRNSGTTRISPEQAALPKQNSSRSSRGTSQTASSSTEVAKAEAAHRAARQHQSMTYLPLPLAGPGDDDYGAGELRSLQPCRGQEEDLDPDDLGSQGAYGGQRPFSSLPYLGSSSLQLPANSKYALLNRSVVELSRKHFDVAPQLKLKIYMDDITRTRSDVVVNAANWELKNVGGVAGALAKAAGPQMEQDCQQIYQQKGALRTAQVVKTKAYGKLSHLKYVFHTVGPLFRKEDPDRCVFELAQTFLNCLQFAEKLNLDSITFPFISTGIFGMPVDLCVVSLLTALRKHGHDRFVRLSALEEVHFINNDFDVVCNAVISAEKLAKVETVDACLKRMEAGEKLYGASVYPFCDQKTPSTATKSAKDDRFASWDSSGDKGAAAADDEENRSRRRQRSNQDALASGSQSMSAAVSTASSSRGRSHSADRGHKTVASAGSSAKPSSGTKGRESSPMPKPRSRSSSMTSERRGSDEAGKAGGSSPPSASTPTPRAQPLIKQPLVPAPTSGGKKRSSGLAKSVARGRTADHSGNDTDLSSAATSESEEVDRTCPICLDDLTAPKRLACGHQFCTRCVDKALALNPRCPKCQRLFGIPTGTQPRDGTMTHSMDYRSHLPGYHGCGTITITYSFPPGVQEACHPNPGRWHEGTHRVAYLPGNSEGRDVLKMLQKAFDHRLVFTIGDSITTGKRGVITWNDIHHKTSTYGGPSSFGYPDPDYLYRVKEELAAKGISHP